jgi:ABC-2 type transport system ATP-binding protein
MTDAIVLDGLRKTYDKTVALDGLSLNIPAGLVYGLLGPNGAGKTTTVRVLATLTRPTGGTARVAGLDVVRDAAAVRHTIGVTGQYAALDEDLTGRENLVLVGRLHGLSARDARARAVELLELVGMSDAADRSVKTYSGGMRRRVDLGASLVARPRVLFLDEPTTGLDPRSRVDLWTVLGTLVTDGTTVLLTTQYLEEVDRLASRIAVIDHGRLIAEGTPAELKRATGGEVIEVHAADGYATVIASALRSIASADPFVHGRTIIVPVERGIASLAAAIDELDARGLAIEGIALRAPTLDEVFMKLTGHSADEAA